MFLEELEKRLQIENFAESHSVNKQFETFSETFRATKDQFTSAKKTSR